MGNSQPEHEAVDGTAADPESGPTGGLSAGTPSAAEARTALDVLDTDASQLAARLETPWWHHLVLGAMVSAAIGGQALPRVSSMTVIVLVIIGIPFLMKAYTSRYRVWMSEPAGPRSRRQLVLLMVALVVLMASGVLVKIASLSLWWVLVPAALGLLATVWLGRRYDDALRADLSTPAPTSPRR